MRYASVCSGVEAASLAWIPLGWEAAWFSEIEPFPCAVLKARFPDVPNLGDMTKIKVENVNGEQHFTNGSGADVVIPGGVDLLVGGTPCQSFSVAGKQSGLRGVSGLALAYCELLKTIRPSWFVWENVPGVFSTNGGEDFKTLLRTFDEIGYSCAWRVLDAQYVRVDGYPRAVPQRRRRVFVVGHLGEWQYPASVLFEPDCLLGNTPPRRIKGKGFAAGFAGGPGTASGIDGSNGTVTGNISGTVDSHCRLPNGSNLVGRLWDASGVNPTLNQCNAGSEIIGASNQELFSQNANGLVMDAKFWNGEDVSTTLTEAFADDRMPDKGKLPCVITESGRGFYSESAVGQTLEAHEDQHRRNIICAGFCQGASPAAGSIGYHEQVSPTIKAGESGTAQVPALLCVHGSQDPIVNSDHANAIGRNQGAENCVCQYGDVAGSLTARHDSSPCADRGMNVVCMQQNTRNEVRLMNGNGQIAGALSAEPGAKQQNYVCFNPQDSQTSRIYGTNGSYPSLSANNGGGQDRSGVLCYENHAQDSRIKTLDGVCSQICANAGMGGGNLPLVQSIAIAENVPGVAVCTKGNGDAFESDVHTSITASGGGQAGQGYPACRIGTTVRRLLAVECERLMGFPDNWTRIPWKGKPESDCPDSPRYKACGNSMCVNVMRWIGMRIELAERKTKWRGRK